MLPPNCRYFSIHALRLSERPVVAVKSIQSRIVEFRQRAAMKLVRPVLRHHFHLRSRVAAIHRRVGARQHLNFLHRFFVRSHHRRAAPTQTVRAHSVHLIVVRRYALAIRHDLHLVLNLEDQAVRSARPLLSREDFARCHLPRARHLQKRPASASAVRRGPGQPRATNRFPCCSTFPKCWRLHSEDSARQLPLTVTDCVTSPT